MKIKIFVAVSLVLVIGIALFIIFTFNPDSKKQLQYSDNNIEAIHDILDAVNATPIPEKQEAPPENSPESPQELIIIPSQTPAPTVEPVVSPTPEITPSPSPVPTPTPAITKDKPSPSAAPAKVDATPKQPVIKKASLFQQDGYFSLTSEDYVIKQAVNTENSYSQASRKNLHCQILSSGDLVGLIEIDQYLLNNGDHYYYIYYHPAATSNEVLQLSLPLNLNSFKYRYITYPKGLDQTKSVLSDVIDGSAGAKLPVSSLMLETDNAGYFISYVNIFEKQQNEVKKEKYDLSNPITVNSDNITMLLPNIKNHVIEQWGIISTQPLIDWNVKDAYDSYRIADLNRVRKWCGDGQYYVTPDSYFPSSSTSFWRNPAYHIAEKFLRTSGGRFFEDLAIVSMYTACRTMNDKAYWYSTPRSGWLYKDYGIGAYFYDTRFNTDVALFLLMSYNKYKDSYTLETVLKHADFLLDFAEAHHYSTSNGGYLVWDYGYDAKPGIKNHVSLNHLITEMNFLLELYKVVPDQKYLNIAEKIRIAVKDTSPYWKREDTGDLWYAYLVDGTYGLKDYPLLTLKDLRYSQRLIEEVSGQRDEDFEYLIKVKEEYLRKINHPLY